MKVLYPNDILWCFDICIEAQSGGKRRIAFVLRAKGINTSSLLIRFPPLSGVTFTAVFVRFWTVIYRPCTVRQGSSFKTPTGTDGNHSMDGSNPYCTNTACSPSCGGCSSYYLWGCQMPSHKSMLEVAANASSGGDSRWWWQHGSSTIKQFKKYSVENTNLPL